MNQISPMYRIKRMHFIGIGGAGMSGIAEVLLNLGYNVTGSDQNISAVTQRLTALGAHISRTHTRENVQGAEVVVASSAISPENPELLEAHRLNIPVLPRAQMLAELMRFHYGIAVAGTHGKTTTTSLLATILSEAGLDPTFVVGGFLNSTKVNARLGTGQYFVVEADESDASFLHFNPMASIITNIDADHMVTYGGEVNRLKEAFLAFLHRLPFYGLAVVCYDEPWLRAMVPEIARPVITYGFSTAADIKISNFQQTNFSCTFSADLQRNGHPLELQLNLPGQHNVLNAVATALVAHEFCGVDFTTIARALRQFRGVSRRMQSYGELTLAPGKQITLIDDYGHHPREIQVTLAALRAAFPNRRLVLAFQPHRYTRTKDLLAEFITVLSSVEQLLLMEIYAASEEPIPGVNTESLIDMIKTCQGANDHNSPVYVQDNEDLLYKLPGLIQHNDVLLIQGAGSIGAVAATLQREFATKN